MTVKIGDKVKIDYEGRFEDGEIFDSSSHGDHSHPLEFEVGAQQVIKGLDDALVGMSVNDEKEITIIPENAYGDIKPEMLKEIPKSALPKDKEPEEGMGLILGTPSGQSFPAKIVKVGEEKVTIDINHPLAGKTLIFKIKLIEIN